MVPVGRVGFDIAISSEFDLSLASAILSVSEKKYIQSRAGMEDQVKLLADLWALKEAYLKMLGTGLGKEPSTVGFDMDAWEQGAIRLENEEGSGKPAFSFRLWEWSSDVLAAVCSDCEIENLSVQLVDWNTVVDAVEANLG